MLQNWQFQLPTQVRFGRGGLRRLGAVAEEFGSSALLVGYRDQTGLEETYARARRALDKADISVAPFFEVTPEPDAELAAEGARRAGGVGVQVIIGLGGGSVIDTAKGIAALAGMGGNIWDYTAANENAQPITDAMPLVAVPTTAGTGTEVTAVAVFTCHGVGPMPELPFKTFISAPALLPKVALVDPGLTVGSPPRLTAACGADALGHAMEACISRRANPVATALASQAVSLVTENLARAVHHPDDPRPREALALAATLAGAAFDSAGVTMAHSIAQALGGLLHVPHGEAVAVATPLSLRYNAECCVEQYSRLGHACDITADSPEEQAGRFADQIIELLRSVDLPPRVQVPDGAPNDLPNRLARNAFDGCPVPLKLNPRKIDRVTLARLIQEIIYYPPK